MTHSRSILIGAGILLALALPASSQQSPQPQQPQQAGQCCMGGHHGGRGAMMHDAEHHQDMALFHFLLDHRQQIRRQVEELPNGVDTVTESDDPEIASKIREHVGAMYRRLEEDRPIHQRDPLFAEIFRHADAIEMQVTETEKGLRVRETSSDPYVAKLIQEHARVVTAFLDNGYPEMHQDHPLPPRPGAEASR